MPGACCANRGRGAVRCTRCLGSPVDGCCVGGHGGVLDWL